jgi:glyoxylase-like metal-dependent hydrolase (beta-lactamase superfamily II)
LHAWKIGDVKVTRILEQELELPLDAVLRDPPSGIVAKYPWLHPDFLVDDVTCHLAIQGFVIDTSSVRVLVDTCVGEHADLTPIDDPTFLDRLAQAGYKPEDIDVVVCTHMHFDHVGWNTRLVDGEWVVTFPAAQYLFARLEWEHWSKESSPFVNLDERVRPVLASQQAELVEMTHAICDEVRLVPTPGHTPGHVSVVIASEGELAVITGDMIHHPLQVAEPDIGTNADSDSAAAVTTRRTRFAEWAADRALVIGTHFAGPVAGHFVPSGDAWQLQVGSARA